MPAYNRGRQWSPSFFLLPLLHSSSSPLLHSKAVLICSLTSPHIPVTLFCLIFFFFFNNSQEGTLSVKHCKMNLHSAFMYLFLLEEHVPIFMYFSYFSRHCQRLILFAYCINLSRQMGIAKSKIFPSLPQKERIYKEQKDKVKHIFFLLK